MTERVFPSRRVRAALATPRRNVPRNKNVRKLSLLRQMLKLQIIQ